MKNNKILLASVLAMLSTSAMAQSSSKGNFEASASIESFCQMNAADINFGVVNLPLTAQSANAKMNVLCSNNTPYKIDISYGESVNGEEKPNYTLKIHSIENSYSLSRYKVYLNDEPVSTNNFDIACMSGNDGAYFTSLEIAQIFGSSIVKKYAGSTTGICDGQFASQNWMDKIVMTIIDKGVMTGSFKGDKLAYQITLPNDSTKAWIEGVNSYSATGLGINQVIEMNAKIVPSASSSSYIAQDTYIDTVTATVSY